MARHFFTFKNTTRGLALTDGTRRTMRQRVTMGGITHSEMVTLDRPGETLTDGHTRDVHLLTGLEDIHLYLTTGL